MQVSLLPNYAAALVHNRMGGMLSSVPGRSPEPAIPAQRDELRERVRRDEEREARAVATLVPTRSADVINDAERNLERSSRAFRRQVARDGAAEQFQQDRRAFRQSLAGAREKGMDLTSRNSTDAEAQPSAKLRAKVDAASHGTPTDKAGPRVGAASAKAPTLSDAARPLGSQVPGLPGASARVASSAGRGVVPNAAATQALRAAGSDSTGARAADSRVAASRLASPPQVRAARPGGAGGLKAGGTTPGAPLRPLAKAQVLAPAKASGARPAENAAWDANIERIVRVIRSRMSEQRSHTVLRLAPPELGSLRLQMDLRGFALTLRIDTTTELAHRLLSQDVDKLRHGLEASGIQLERVEVRPPTQPSPADEHDVSQHTDQHGQAQGESSRTDAEHPEERGTESHPAESTEGMSRGADPEPAAESLVNVVA